VCVLCVCGVSARAVRVWRKWKWMGKKVFRGESVRLKGGRRASVSSEEERI
jgi:hypothetical protein